MAFSDDILACARLLERGDAARFRAVMAAPAPVRPKLFAIFAFNLEVTRAPWVTQEPMIAEMRLQWWQDALGEIAAGGDVRRHEVVTPLADALSVQAAEDLRDLVTARRWDIYREPFTDAGDFGSYLRHTSGRLLRVAAQALGPADSILVEDFGSAVGLANFFTAVPALIAAGRQPLLDPSPEAIRALAERGLQQLVKARAARGEVSPQAGAALLCGSAAKGVLVQAQRAPEQVISGLQPPAPFAERLGLLLRSFSGRW